MGCSSGRPKPPAKPAVTTQTANGNHALIATAAGVPAAKMDVGATGGGRVVEIEAAGASSAVGVAMDRDVRPWLDLMDKLRAFGIEKDMPIPQLSVMGDQSSGKSSVLEFLSGVPFPRGSGLVTRCATQLTMKRVHGQGFRGTAAVRWDQPQQPAASGPIHSKADVAEKIEQLTAALVGDDPFSSSTIVVEIEAPDVPDLTIIDLPGLVRTTTLGQKTSIIKQVDALVQRYLEIEQTIVLAVVPATVDIATSDILERALQVDPNGVRTVGVLTKLDLVGSGDEDETMQVLENVRKPLKLGYVGLRCRSQAEIKANRSLDEARKEELAFFSTHPVFRHLPSSTVGVDTLTTKLTRVLVSRIRQAVPGMADDIASQLKETEVSLSALGGSPPATKAEQQEALVERIGVFADLLRAAVQGRYDNSVFDDASFRLRTDAAKTYDAFQARITQDLRPEFEDEDFLAGITQLVADCRGRELPCFPSVHVFDTMVQQTVDAWSEPAADCRHSVVQQLRAVVRKLVERVFVKYPNLSVWLVGFAATLIDEVDAACATALDRLVVYERTPLTLAPAFMEMVSVRRKTVFEKLAAVIRKNYAAQVKRADMDCKAVEVGDCDVDAFDVSHLKSPQEILIALEAFWSVSSVRFVDNVAMAVQNDVLEAGLMRIKTSFYMGMMDADLDSLFAEDGSLRDQRMALAAKRSRLRQAQAAMQQLRGA